MQPEIRTPAEADLPGLIALVNALAAEAGGLFVLPIEGAEGAAILRAHLAEIARTGHEAVLVAACDGAIAGLVTATRGAHPARLGVVEIGIGVAAGCRGRGIGRALMMAIERWADGAGVHRLSLSVVTTNRPAIALYRSLGYELEGTRVANAALDGRYVHEFMMGKLIGAAR